MIKNDKQLASTKEKLQEFKLAQKAIKPAKKDDFRAKLHTNAIKSTLESLNNDIREYESLKNENLCAIQVKDFYDLSKALIKARIAKAWTQTDLARKMEIDVQQIQRYEARDYEGASIERIQEVIDALEIVIDIKPIIVQKSPIHNNEKSLAAQQKIYLN